MREPAESNYEATKRQKSVWEEVATRRVEARGVAHRAWQSQHCGRLREASLPLESYCYPRKQGGERKVVESARLFTCGEARMSREIKSFWTLERQISITLSITRSPFPNNTPHMNSIQLIVP